MPPYNSGFYAGYFLAAGLRAVFATSSFLRHRANHRKPGRSGDLWISESRNPEPREGKLHQRSTGQDGVWRLMNG
ncbi:hypothetical protein BDW62DRAFT_175015 [Aspergillus aurantiobrunneus]